MRLRVGPPGSGKTTAILREARSFIREGDANFRLVVPSSTMAEHLRNALAREGLVVRPSTIVTLAGLVAALTPGLQQASGEDLALIVGGCLTSGAFPAFAGLSETPGLARTIAGSIEDLANSGCGPLEWTAMGRMSIWRGRIFSEFGQIWEAVERILAERGLVLRAGRIAQAAAAVRRGMLPATLEAVYVDGFFSFSRIEVELLQSLDKRTHLTVTLPDWPGAAVIRQLLERQRCEVVQHRAVRSQPRLNLVAAVDPQREVEEITLRILEAKKEGFTWRDMAVIMRSARTYAPLIQRAFARAGIPSRSYFAQPLSGTSVFRYLDDLILAVNSGWEYRQTLAAVSSSTHTAGATAAAKALERVVVEALPGEGLEEFSALAGRVALPGSARIQELLQSWRDLSSWRSESVSPADWASRLIGLSPKICAPSLTAQVSRGQLDADRLRSAALLSVQQGLESTSRILAQTPLPLEAFWRSASFVLASNPVRMRDTRRDVVHVMDVHEARQWELPVIFVCGLTEGGFPLRVSADPLLGDELRVQMQAQGYPLLTSTDRDREETFLCEFAQTRATSRLTLSYPLFASDGMPALRAFALDAFSNTPEPGRPLRIKPSAPVVAAPRYSLQSPEVLSSIRREHATFKPTSLEDYLQCPFRFFARRTLRLREWPAEPEDRVGPLTLGIVMHDAINRWHEGGQRENLVDVLETQWRRELARLRVARTWRTETQWLLLERSARFYMTKGLPEPGWSINTEQTLSLSINGFRFEGRADRVERDIQNNARVVEFKFVGSAGLKRRKGKLEVGLAVQAPLYALALQQRGLQLLSYSIVGLRGDTIVVTYDDPDAVRAGMELAALKASTAAFQITQGDIRVMPADTEMCGYCAYLDACRKRDEAVEPEAAEAGEAQI